MEKYHRKPCDHWSADTEGCAEEEQNVVADLQMMMGKEQPLLRRLRSREETSTVQKVGVAVGGLYIYSRHATAAKELLLQSQ